MGSLIIQGRVFKQQGAVEYAGIQRAIQRTQLTHAKGCQGGGQVNAVELRLQVSGQPLILDFQPALNVQRTGRFAIKLLVRLQLGNVEPPLFQRQINGQVMQGLASITELDEVEIQPRRKGPKPGRPPGQTEQPGRSAIT